MSCLHTAIVAALHNTTPKQTTSAVGSPNAAFEPSRSVQVVSRTVPSAMEITEAELLHLNASSSGRKKRRMLRVAIVENTAQ